MNNEADPEFLVASMGEIGLVFAVMASIVSERTGQHHQDSWLDEATAPESEAPRPYTIGENGVGGFMPPNTQMVGSGEASARAVSFVPLLCVHGQRWSAW